MTKGRFHHFRGSSSLERGTIRKLHTSFVGRPNLESMRLTVEEKQYFTPVLTCLNLSKPVLTCSQYSDHVCSLRNVNFCTFESCYSSVLRPILMKLHIFARIIEGFPMVYGFWRCIEVKMSIPLGAHAFRSSMERFQHCNFLALRPLLLENAYFSSANRELFNGVRLVELH